MLLASSISPQLSRVAVLFHDGAPWAVFYVRAAQDAGERLSLKTTAAVVHDVAAIEPAIAAMSGDGGLVGFPKLLQHHESGNNYRARRQVSRAGDLCRPI